MKRLIGTGFFQVNGHDLLKGFITAVFTVIVASLGMSVNSQHVPTLADLQTAGAAGLTAGIAYLMKNLFTNSRDRFMTKEPPKP